MTVFSELDTIFISYDEDNAEENYAHLLTRIPWAKRVHGVKGFDAAHKAAAELSETKHFITVDGDSQTFEHFFQLECDLERKYPESVLSWNAKNFVNGLVYGNGGLKIWPKQTALNMQTHENSKDPKSNIEFCWGLDYIQMNNVYSLTYPNGSPMQAFRSGFREGVKMTLIEGKRVSVEDFKDHVWYENYKRLLMWCNIGADVDNGIYCILGARMGAYENLTNKNFDQTHIRDFDWFNEKYQEGLEDAYQDIIEYGTKINNLADLTMVIKPNEEVSKLFKETWTDPRQTDPFMTEGEVSELFRRNQKKA